MESLLALVIGGMVAVSVYMLLRRDLVRMIVGVVILSNAVNLLIFTLGRMTRAESPLIAVGETVPPETIANPLSQALILTAIVIGFGLLAFSLVLIYRMHKSWSTVDANDLVEAEEPSV